MSEKALTEQVPGIAKLIGDGTSIGVVVGTLVEFLPAWAALMTIIWTGIRIYETKTVQEFLKRKKK